MSKRMIQIACILYIVLIIVYPQASMQGASEGIDAFLNTVLPTLLPFFIGTSILVGSGVVLSSARLLSPIASKCIGLPGASIFAWIMAAVSGYPLGAKLTSELYAKGYLDPIEAKRTIILSSVTGPSFLFGAVATGLLHRPQIGWILLTSHLLSSIVVGYLSWLFYPNRAQHTSKKFPPYQNNGNLFSQAVTSSIASLASIGGCMIFFSSLSCVLKESGILTLLQIPISYLLELFGFGASLAPGMVSGLFEMTSGCIAIASAPATLVDQATLCCFIVTFGGLSIFFQCLPYFKASGLRPLSYLFFKVAQAIIALFLCRLLFLFLPQTLPTFSSIPSGFVPSIAFSGSLLIFGCCAISFFGAVMVLINLVAYRKYKKHTQKKSS